MLEYIKTLTEKNDLPILAQSPEFSIMNELYPSSKRFFFLFKQGINKTNLAHFELISLLRLHVKDSNESENTPFQIVSHSEFCDFVSEFFSSTEPNTFDDWQRVSNSISKFCVRRIIYTTFETGAIVYIPSNMKVELSLLTKESGYIHSCGDLVFNWDSQTANELLVKSSLDIYVNKTDESEKFLIVPYCHEDFSFLDRDESEFLSDGLDNVKINISKTYVGETPMHDFITDYVDTNKEKIVSAPSNYKNSKSIFNEQFPNCPMATIWIISDRRIFKDKPSESNRYIICYRQRFKNENPYHHYEENKPAWVSHTTLPHSLAGAMINIARPWLPNESPVICDPFCGSGTIYLEAKKFQNLQCFTSDKSPLAEKILEDNIEFFKMDPSALRDVIGKLEQIDKSAFSNLPKSLVKKSSKVQKYGKVIEVIDGWSLKYGENFLDVSSEDVDIGFNSIGSDLVDRLVLYISLRASVRGRTEMQRADSSWLDIFDRERQKLLKQMNNHLKSIDSFTAGVGDNLIGEGRYSPVTLTPKPHNEKADLFSSGHFDLRSVQDLPKSAFDALICDPPYGFNTQTDRWVAEDFASEMIPAMVESLKPFGQIVMASPNISYSGRKIPPPLRSDSITRSILEYCAETNRQCWQPSLSSPTELRPRSKPPYFWKAPKTLNRHILHFWIEQNT